LTKTAQTQDTVLYIGGFVELTADVRYLATTAGDRSKTEITWTKSAGAGGTNGSTHADWWVKSGSTWVKAEGLDGDPDVIKVLATDSVRLVSNTGAVADDEIKVVAAAASASAAGIDSDNIIGDAKGDPDRDIASSLNLTIRAWGPVTPETGVDAGYNGMYINLDSGVTINENPGYLLTGAEPFSADAGTGTASAFADFEEVQTITYEFFKMEFTMDGTDVTGTGTEPAKAFLNGVQLKAGDKFTGGIMTVTATTTVVPQPSDSAFVILKWSLPQGGATLGDKLTDQDQDLVALTGGYLRLAFAAPAGP
jgi:hypothetical protein